MFGFKIPRVRRSLRYAGRVRDGRLEEQAALVALLTDRPRGLNWSQLTDLVLESGSAARVRAELRSEMLLEDPDGDDALARAAADVESWQLDGTEFLTIVDQRYPARVRDIQEAPPFLFAQGRLIADDVAVSVVGSRQASPRGLDIASSVATRLSDEGITVAAGLAAGIDTAAHLAALHGGGRTVAFIGTGIRHAYPAANRDLQRRIAEVGLVLSQFWPDAPPQQHNFPMRNAVMSGYGVATVVVEAGERSGARIQARKAVEHGRPVILTDLVVDRTEWGRRLVDRPDVYVAGSVREVTAIVHELIDRPRVITEALAQLAI